MSSSYPNPNLSYPTVLVVDGVESPLAWCLLVPVCGVEQDEVTFSTSGAGQGYIYDEAPKLKLKGSGFENIYAEIDQLELVFDPPIEKGDVFANVGVRAGDMLVLDLIQGKRLVL